MKRHLFNILSTVSLVLCLAVSLFWVHSYYAVDASWPVFLSPNEIRLLRGQVIGCWWYGEMPKDYAQLVMTDWRYLGFTYEQNRLYLMARIPYWFPALLTLILPGWWLRNRFGQQRKTTPGLCLTCGYDLRAHKPGDRCPECGTPVPADLAGTSVP